MVSLGWFDLLAGTIGVIGFVYGAIERLWPETRLATLLRHLEETDAQLISANEAGVVSNFQQLEKKLSK